MVRFLPGLPGVSSTETEGPHVPPPVPVSSFLVENVPGGQRCFGWDKLTAFFVDIVLTLECHVDMYYVPAVTPDIQHLTSRTSLLFLGMIQLMEAITTLRSAFSPGIVIVICHLSTGRVSLPLLRRWRNPGHSSVPGTPQEQYFWSLTLHKMLLLPLCCLRLVSKKISPSVLYFYATRPCSWSPWLGPSPPPPPSPAPSSPPSPAPVPSPLTLLQFLLVMIVKQGEGRGQTNYETLQLYYYYTWASIINCNRLDLIGDTAVTSWPLAARETSPRLFWPWAALEDLGAAWWFLIPPRCPLVLDLSVFTWWEIQPSPEMAHPTWLLIAELKRKCLTIFSTEIMNPSPPWLQWLDNGGDKIQIWFQ